MTEQRVFTERDDRFHFEAMAGDWWATETAWFSFSHPERRLGGWLYTMVRALPTVPVGFVHIPPSGLDPEVLRRAIEELCAP